MKAQVGDWVAFMRDGVIVIGEVRYMKRQPSWVSGTHELITDVGSVADEHVLEVRRRGEARDE